MNSKTLPPETPDPMRTYLRSECVVIFRTKEEYGGLSNMAGGYPLQVNKNSIRTSEALYQACRFPHLPEIQKSIIDQKSPMTAKMKSKPHRKNSRPDWDVTRAHIMRWCLRVKLAQNHYEFGRLLLSTRDKTIVEQSRRDPYWGALVQKEDEGTLVGQNVLGRLLMELREQLKLDTAGVLKTVPPMTIPDFLLYGKAIETVTAITTANKNPQITLI